ncbi:MAG TPA: hypothetical protein VGF45_00130 [Polyangia bacterium]
MALVPPQLSIAGDARTDDHQQKAAARALFHEGLAFADAQRWSEAADRFERARVLRPSPEVTYNLCTSLVKLRKLVRASELLREIMDDPHASAQVKTAARARLVEVVPRLAYLTIRMPTGTRVAAAGGGDGADSLVVLVDGQPFDEARLGVALPMDPTSHTVHLRLGTTVLDRRELLLDEGERRVVSFEPGAAPVPVSSRGWEPGQAEKVLAPATSLDVKNEARRSGAWVWVLVGAAVAVGLTATTVAVALHDSPMQPRGNVDTWTIGN